LGRSGATNERGRGRARRVGHRRPMRFVRERGRSGGGERLDSGPVFALQDCWQAARGVGALWGLWSWSTAECMPGICVCGQVRGDHLAVGGGLNGGGAVSSWSRMGALGGAAGRWGCQDGGDRGRVHARCVQLGLGAGEDGRLRAGRCSCWSARRGRAGLWLSSVAQRLGDPR